jgi:hypothetical protein
MKKFLEHPTMILANDFAAFGFVIVCSLFVGLALFSVVVGGPCPECVLIVAKPFSIAAHWVNGLH